MTEGVQPADGVDPGRTAVGEDDAARPDRRADEALADDAVADRRRGVVTSAGRDGNTGGQPGRLRRRRRDVAGHVRTLVDVGQPPARDVEGGKDVVRPPAATRAEEKGA